MSIVSLVLFIISCLSLLSFFYFKHKSLTRDDEMETIYNLFSFFAYFAGWAASVLLFSFLVAYVTKSPALIIPSSVFLTLSILFGFLTSLGRYYRSVKIISAVLMALTWTSSLIFYLLF